jgi:hypothetical protein
MSTEPAAREPFGGGDACDACGRELPPFARTVGVVSWCSFLVASAATTVVFAFVDPEAVEVAGAPGWFRDRLTVYALGFFFFWFVAAAAASLTLYMALTDRGGARPPPPESR